MKLTPIDPHKSYQLFAILLDEYKSPLKEERNLQLLDIVTGAELEVKPVWSLALKVMFVPYVSIISQGFISRFP